MFNKLPKKIYVLLRWSEKYTKTDMVYVGTSGFWLMSGQVLAAATALGLSILFANMLSKDVFGMYRYVLSMAGIAAAFSLTGANAAVVRAVAQHYDGILKPILIAQLWWSLPRLLFGLAISAYYLYQSHTVYAISFLIVAILAPLASIANTYGPFLEGKKLFKESSLMGVSVNLVNVVALATVSFFFPSVVVLVLAYYLSLTLAGAYFTWKTYATYPTDPQTTRDADLEYAKKLSVMNIVSTLAVQADSILVYHLLGPAQLATFTFATLIPERIRSMFGVIATAALPRLSEKQGSRADINIVDKVLRLLLLAAVMVAAYWFIAPYVFKLLFPQYADSVLYSQVYALSLLAIASNIPIPALFAEQRNKELYMLSIGLPSLKIAVSAGAIFTMGIWGAVLAKIMHYMLYVVLSTFYAANKRGA